MELVLFSTDAVKGIKGRDELTDARACGVSALKSTVGGEIERSTTGTDVHAMPESRG